MGVPGGGGAVAPPDCWANMASRAIFIWESVGFQMCSQFVKSFQLEMYSHEYNCLNILHDKVVHVYVSI